LSAIKIHLDEDADSHAFLNALRHRGWDVTSTREAGLLGCLDEEQLAWANQQLCRRTPPPLSSPDRSLRATPRTPGRVLVAPARTRPTPTVLEFDRYDELRHTVRSPRRAERLLLKHHGLESYHLAQAARKNDLLVYLALANLRKGVPFGYLPPGLRTDIKTFHHDYGRALAHGRDLLFAAGDPDEIALACEDTSIGWQDAQALYVHRQLLDRLPPLLRRSSRCWLEQVRSPVRRSTIASVRVGCMHSKR